MPKWMGPTDASFRVRHFPRWPISLIESPWLWLAVAALLIWFGLSRL